MVSIVHASNALGTVNPIKEIAVAAHQVGAIVVVDGAQAAPHLAIDVQDLNCDFFCLSGHKMYGPTGAGVLYGKRRILEQMPPYQGGGEMIKEVHFEETTYNDIPYKFEAGTPNIADVVALKKAFEFINQLGKENIAAMSISPRQLMCEEKGAKLRIIPINDLGEIDMAAFEDLLSEKTKVVYPCVCWN